jgi:hypothetical protein
MKTVLIFKISLWKVDIRVSWMPLQLIPILDLLQLIGVDGKRSGVLLMLAQENFPEELLVTEVVSDTGWRSGFTAGGQQLPTLTQVWLSRTRTVTMRDNFSLTLKKLLVLIVDYQELVFNFRLRKELTLKVLELDLLVKRKFHTSDLETLSLFPIELNQEHVSTFSSMIKM